MNDNGGSAFPHTPSRTEATGVDDLHVFHHGQVPGLSALDYFAAEAMHAEIVTCGVPGEAADALFDAMEPFEEVPEHIARISYDMADAMLKERARRAGLEQPQVEQHGFDGLLDTLKELDGRLRECAKLGDGCSARDAYDSFYQDMVTTAIAVAEGRIFEETQPAIVAVDAELEQLRAKAARYDFIRSQMRAGAVQTQLPLVRSIFWVGTYVDCAKVEHADEAIDNAIQAAKEGGTS